MAISKSERAPGKTAAAITCFCSISLRLKFVLLWCRSYRRFAEKRSSLSDRGWVQVIAPSSRVCVFVFVSAAPAEPAGLEDISSPRRRRQHGVFSFFEWVSLGSFRCSQTLDVLPRWAVFYGILVRASVRAGLVVCDVLPPICPLSLWLDRSDHNAVAGCRVCSSFVVLLLDRSAWRLFVRGFVYS